MFCMGNPDRKLPEDIIHLYSDDYIVTKRPPLTDKEQDELLDMLDYYEQENKKNGQHWAILFFMCNELHKNRPFWYFTDYKRAIHYTKQL